MTLALRPLRPVSQQSYPKSRHDLLTPWPWPRIVTAWRAAVNQCRYGPASLFVMSKIWFYKAIPRVDDEIWRVVQPKVCTAKSKELLRAIKEVNRCNGSLRKAAPEVQGWLVRNVSLSAHARYPGLCRGWAPAAGPQIDRRFIRWGRFGGRLAAMASASAASPRSRFLPVTGTVCSSMSFWSVKELGGISTNRTATVSNPPRKSSQASGSPPGRNSWRKKSASPGRCCAGSLASPFLGSDAETGQYSSVLDKNPRRGGEILIVENPQLRITREPIGFAGCQFAADFAGNVRGEQFFP